MLKSLGIKRHYATNPFPRCGLPFEAQKVQSLNLDLIAVRELEVIPFDEAMDLADLVYKIMFFLKNNCS